MQYLLFLVGEVFVILKYNASRIWQNIVHILLYACSYKKLYKVLMHKCYTIRSIVNFLLVLMVAIYRETGIKHFLQFSKTQQILTH